MQTIPDGLLEAVVDRYDIEATTARALHGGTASKVWRLNSDPPLVVRLSQYLELDDLHRSCGVATAFARAVPEAIGPLVGKGGEPAFVWNDQPISVWPYVDGLPADRNDPDHRRQSARLLARLHRATLDSPALDTPGLDTPGLDTPGLGTPGLGTPGLDDHRQPPDQGDSEAPERGPKQTELLADPGLDEWLRRWRTGESLDGPTGWMHRDFFPGNVLVRDGTLVGLVDWDEVTWGPLITELAWSVWEFGKSPEGDTLLVDRAVAFLAAYREAGGPVRPSYALIPLIRDRLRHGVAFWSWVLAEGHPVDPSDIRAMTEAFGALRDLRLPLPV